MTVTPSTLSLVTGVQNVMAELDVAISKFQDETRWGCREGCGDCCNSPEIEVTVLEALPHALLLWESSKAELFHEVLASRLGQRCAFYVPETPDQSKGRCSIYSTRPMLCQMFGFTAQTHKDDKARMVACKWQKLSQPELLKQIDADLISGELQMPLFAYWQSRLSELDPSRLLSERLPINEAFLKAIDYVYWRRSEL
ncbi:MAG: YkgJ family cysteine cluster protein [Bdellovibrionota bacterium]